MNLRIGHLTDYGPAEQDELEEQVKSLLAQGFIRPKSKSIWSSGIIHTKEGWTLAKVHRLPRIKSSDDKGSIPTSSGSILCWTVLDLLKSLQKLDLASGYHQISMDKGSIYRTALYVIIRPVGISGNAVWVV